LRANQEIMKSGEAEHRPNPENARRFRGKRWGG
jgi:hypothetical protein